MFKFCWRNVLILRCMGNFEWEVESFLFEYCENFWAEAVVMDHSVVIWAEAY